ncbi:MAG: aspartyl protease family protein [Dehalococcoidia bacterium]
MGSTQVTATINGPSATRDYRFLVDTGATFLGLPLEDIQELGLTPVPDGRRSFVTATGPVELDTYVVIGHLEGKGFVATAIPAPTPLIGYEILENLRFRVNPVTHELEPVPEEEVHPPFLL